MTDDAGTTLVRAAYEAYARGDVDGMLEVVDPDLTWTFLDPSEPDPEPRTCHGRDELRRALHRQSGQGLRSRIDRIAGHGDQVLLVLHTPGLDQHRARGSRDRNYFVVTVSGSRITALRACRDEAEARALAGLA